MAKFPLKIAKDSLQDTLYYIRNNSHFSGFNATAAKLRISKELDIDPNSTYAVYGALLAVELANKHKEYQFVKTWITEYKIGQRMKSDGKFELYAK